MNNKEWICGEITAWRSEGLVTDEVALRLLGRYEQQKGTKISWGAMLAGAFGALLIGLGIIALFAANWDCFGRGTRAAISVSPVVLSGLVAIVASRKGWKTMSLWEPLGILWCIATGAAACLVAQTYQVGGSVPGLILFVALLCLPVVWTTRSVAAMALWPVFAIAWGIASEDADGSSFGLLARSLGLMALSLPAYVAFLRRKPTRAALVTGQLITGLVYALGTAILVVNVLPYLAYAIRTEIYICVFWACAAAVLLAGVLCKLPVWPMIAVLVAAGAGCCTIAEELWIYWAAFAMSVAIVGFGIAKVRLGYTNIGAALLLWLVLGKFFESSIDFTFKGLVFIGAGVVLTLLNVAMVKSKKGRSADGK